MRGGTADICPYTFEAFSVIVPKGAAARVEVKTELPADLTAPVKAGDEIGKITYTLDGTEIGAVPVRTTESIEKIGFLTLLRRLVANFLLA